ncbi:MAG: RsmB/NOP family class I SAM-dependent RNA methyltransferase [Spirochaetota bacterium]
MIRRGAEAFEAYYADVFPARWDAIKTAILAYEERGIALRTAADRPYFLDAASVVPAMAAGPSGDRTILDMCAAPGGKTLVLAGTMTGGGQLTANERSANRRARLRRVLDEHVDSGLRQQITVTSHDARRWGLYETEIYDLILADVPCSSEAHLLKGNGDIAQWTPRRSSRIAIDQYAILRAAVQALKTGGTIVYSTCALSPTENGDLVSRVLKKGAPSARLGTIEPEEEALSFAASHGLTLETCSVGYQILPDRSSGSGPIYFCLIRKDAEDLNTL